MYLENNFVIKVVNILEIVYNEICELYLEICLIVDFIFFELKFSVYVFIVEGVLFKF